ncbi:receptor-binding cancer antigen expressed on SiSo cells [Sabethes cyaneus]|uniref:receptor-binding cancer antigen expressed on SiSo cells n=1 Tax=Sabethes cyaneus TaxID=53552 RepID=UPI00237E999A|nr:receptor-binding cancer antigen expressed on SiSo cells [Sabethes cyaneus]
MIMNLALTRARQLLVLIGALLKRILCCECLRRRRASRVECETLSSVNVVQDANRRYKHVVQKDWNSWDDTPETVEEHIERYREQLVAPASPSEPPPEEQIDYFRDMAPTIVAQQKICIANEQDNGGSQDGRFNRLTAKIDIPVVDGLDDWEEDTDGQGRDGWDDADENTTKQLIRQTRKELRQQRQQQQQHRNHYK